MRTRLKIALELERLRRRNLKVLHPLRQLFWESTLRCNVSCRHCGSDCRSAVTTPDMPKEDFLHVIDTEILPHTDPHHLMIIISGGEPTMRHDLEEVGRELQKREFPWGMVTNGLALTPERFRALRQAGLLSLTVSLDGFEEDHNWMRGNKLSFEKAVQAIRLAAADKRLTWDVVTCVNRRNIAYLPRLREFLWETGVRNWRLFGIDPMGRAKSDPELLLTDGQFTRMLDFIAAEREAGRHVSYSCEGFLGDYEGRVRDHLYQCAAGISVASILIDGSISACTSIRGKYYQGNIYRDSFWQVWENGFRNYRNRSWMRRMEPCNTCKVWRWCEGNGMHLREQDGELMLCHLHRIVH
ncbi:MAG: TIGR04133 family radical SAM/SPASM protein [Paludibacteraceae bacterium]|nr:TIGR04133 family radical SAM/SPASM protein [Paludibacteraceae bacterium]